MDQKHFDKIVSNMEHVACSFRGFSLTKAQFEEVQDLWLQTQLCYLPTYMDNNPDYAKKTGWYATEEPELKIADDGLSIEFGDAKYTLTTPWDISSASAVVEEDTIRGFVEDDCGYFHFFPNFEITHKEEHPTCVKLSDEDVAYWKEYYEANPPDVTAENVLDTIRKRHSRLGAYERAMKVVK